MADDIENDDQWLYGDNADNLPQESESEQEKNGEEMDESVNAEEESDQEQSQTTEKPPVPEELPQENEEPAAEDDETADAEKQNGEGSDKEDYEEDSDDDINVVIGDIDIKTSSAYTSLNIKRGGLLTTSSKGDKGQSVPQSGKFTVEEFDQSGNINGVPVGEFNLDSLEDKPWRKPGADITDYFNYGFNEDTWRAYCERQKRMRVNESGTGLLPLNAIGMPRGPVPIMNDNSKYSGSYTGVRKAGPPPGRRMTGSIDVIGGAPTRIGAPISKVEPPKENVIQVMTADRREYSRKPGFPDMSVPPPTSNFEEFQPEFGFNPEPEPFYGGYEPTQDCQWGKYAGNAGPPDWHPQEIKTLTPASSGAVVPPLPSSIGHHSLNMPPPPVDSVIMPAPSSIKESSPSHRSKSKDREASVRRERDRSREREREKSHRYDRSRSRSHRHKSRSRSPSHRSHRKKKSKRHDDSE